MPTSILSKNTIPIVQFLFNLSTNELKFSLGKIVENGLYNEDNFFPRFSLLCNAIEYRCSRYFFGPYVPVRRIRLRNFGARNAVLCYGGQKKHRIRVVFVYWRLYLTIVRSVLFNLRLGENPHVSLSASSTSQFLWSVFFVIMWLKWTFCFFCETESK